MNLPIVPRSVMPFGPNSNVPGRTALELDLVAGRRFDLDIADFDLANIDCAEEGGRHERVLGEIVRRSRLWTAGSMIWAEAPPDEAAAISKTSATSMTVRGIGTLAAMLRRSTNANLASFLARSTDLVA